MDPPHPKLRLMVSYGGHILPRPHHNSLFYAGGETRIVSFDRLKAASSYTSFTSHLSRTLFKNQPFLLKYQLPDEELDSLISVTTDEDLFNMLEEHDRVSVSTLPSITATDVIEGLSGRPPTGNRINCPVITPVVRQSRIRLFLFSVKLEPAGSGLFDPKEEAVGPVGLGLFDPKLVSVGFVGSNLLEPKRESVGLGLFDPKEESGGCDVVKNNGVVGKGEFEGAGLVDGLMGLNVGGGGGGGVENRGGVPESMVLETNSSFGSSSSSVSMSNLPTIGVHYEDGGVGLMAKKCRVPSSASIESDTSIGSSCVLPKPVALQESMTQLASGVPTFTIEPEKTLAENSMMQLQKTVPLPGYHLPQHLDGKRHQHEVQYIQGNVSYIPQYSAAPLHPTSYYPVYQIPMHQQSNGSYPVNQPCPVYYYPVRPVQSYNMPVYNNVINSQNLAANLPPLHPQTVTVTPPVVHNESLTVQPSSDSAGGFHSSVGSVANGQSQQLTTPPEHVQPSQPLPAAIMDISNNSNELDESIAYTSMYKTQPSMPVVHVLPSHYPDHAFGASVVKSDPSTQHMNAKPLATSHPQ